MENVITLAHGSGSIQTNELINNIFKSNFENEYLTADDAAVQQFAGEHLNIAKN